MVQTSAKVLVRAKSGKELASRSATSLDTRYLTQFVFEERLACPAQAKPCYGHRPQWPHLPSTQGQQKLYLWCLAAKNTAAPPMHWKYHCCKRGGPAFHGNRQHPLQTKAGFFNIFVIREKKHVINGVGVCSKTRRWMPRKQPKIAASSCNYIEKRVQFPVGIAATSKAL